MSNGYGITDTVKEIGTIGIQGNIIPHQWYETVTFENGKPQLNAIIILAEIVYWYRPNEVRDEATGRLVRMEKKFKADLLQRSYASFSDQFGLSKKQVKDAILCLEALGVVRRELRTVNTSTGPVSNVMFIDLNPAALRRITHGDVQSYGHQSTHPPTSKYTPPSIDVQTYTETTTETTPEIKEPGFKNSENNKLPPDPHLEPKHKDLAAAQQLYLTKVSQQLTVSPVEVDKIEDALTEFGWDKLKHAMTVAGSQPRTKLRTPKARWDYALGVARNQMTQAEAEKKAQQEYDKRMQERLENDPQYQWFLEQERIQEGQDNGKH